MKLKAPVILLLIQLIIVSKSYTQEIGSVSGYGKVLNEIGREPVDFVVNTLQEYDLVVFDDALHLAKEPFDFYRKLVRNPLFNGTVKYIFIEVFSIASQPYVDDYLNNPVKDSTLLLPVFQNDYSGYGWRYKTYLDVLDTVREVNAGLSESKKIRVICVDQPIYWDAVQTREDYAIFQRSLAARDYFMYKIISQTLDGFKSGDKGIFLTNTRHAYKHIRNSNNELYWNTGTFLNQWHPGKSYAIRLHNVNLSIQSKLDSLVQGSTEGLDKYTYSWIKMENGQWDRAFEENGNVPVAFSLKGNIFGKSEYVGNHMADAAAGQTMYDAYDGLIFLAPLEELHFSAKLDFIYTDAFKQELKRRIRLLQGDRLPDFLKENGVDALDDFIGQLATFQKSVKNTLVPTPKD